MVKQMKDIQPIRDPTATREYEMSVKKILFRTRLRPFHFKL
jgi:hypothetical protein